MLTTFPCIRVRLSVRYVLQSYNQAKHPRQRWELDPELYL